MIRKKDLRRLKIVPDPLIPRSLREAREFAYYSKLAKLWGVRPSDALLLKKLTSDK